MCLTRREQFRPVKVGYKIVYKSLPYSNGRQYVSEFQTSKHMPPGKWLKENDYRPGYLPKDSRGIPLLHPQDKYPFGFHVIHTLRAAKQWRGSRQYNLTIVKVEVKNPVATGTQDIFRCASNPHKGMPVRITVAREIKILDEVN